MANETFAISFIVGQLLVFDTLVFGVLAMQLSYMALWCFFKC